MPEFVEQVLLTIVLPAFYVGLLGFFLAGIKAGFALSNLSLFGAITALVLGKFIIPVLVPGVFGILLSGCAFALVIGILVGYSPRWVMTLMTMRIS